jgi:aminopeptidase
MFDPRIAKLAEVLVRYSVGVRPDDTVFIQGGPTAIPLIKAVVVEVLRSGGHPYTRMTVPDLDELVFRHASDAQLRHVPEPTRVIYESYDAMITFWSSDNTKSLTSVPPEKLVLSNQATKDIFRTFMQRVATQELRWVGTLYPTEAYAQDAEMGLHEYEDFVYGACLPNLEDPVSVWKKLSIWQQKLVDWLDGKKELRVEGPDVDLRMRIAGRTFKNCDGKNNMPDGEIFTGPVEDSVEGHVRFSYPTVYQGRKVDGVRLWFEKGKVVRAEADTGEEFLQKTLDVDAGARYVGEFAVGTNRGITRATGNTLFDEKINGSFHMALGAGMPETGSRNESAIHWDIVCDLTKGGRIYVDDTLIYDSGRFLIGE